MNSFSSGVLIFFFLSSLNKLKFIASVFFIKLFLYQFNDFKEINTIQKILTEYHFCSSGTGGPFGKPKVFLKSIT